MKMKPIKKCGWCSRLRIRKAGICAVLSGGALLLGAGRVAAQADKANYDESKVPHYRLPEPLVCNDGRRVTSVGEWESRRDREILPLFRSQMYGYVPAPEVPLSTEYTVLSEEEALDGRAIRRQVRIRFVRSATGRSPADRQDVLVLIYLPKDKATGEHRGNQRGVPVFLAYNFYGNQTVNADPGILPTISWCRNNERFGVTDHDGSKAIRGSNAWSWPVDTLLSEGFGLVTACYNDIYPDGTGNRDRSVIRLFGDTLQRADGWGAISAWAWGLSRIMDYLEQAPGVDASRVTVTGHSRLGKTALWAAAQDRRFAAVISTNSGCGGAALFRREFGETADLICGPVGYWFCPNFQQYRNNEAALPVDQHELIALMAPRPAYVASATEDLWADPRGEFLSAAHAGEVYALYGYRGLDTFTMPPADRPLAHRVGYHLRTGQHDVTAWDWAQYIPFVKREVCANGK